jgi:hypothetical protein
MILRFDTSGTTSTIYIHISCLTTRFIKQEEHGGATFPPLSIKEFQVLTLCPKLLDIGHGCSHERSS